MSIVTWIVVTMVVMTGIHEFLLALALQHNTLYRVSLRGTDAAGNVFITFTQCVLVDQSPASASFNTFDPTQTVVDPSSGSTYFADPLDGTTPRSLTVSGVAANDVSGVSAVSLCCGTNVQSCDLPVGNAAQVSSVDGSPFT